MQGVPQFCGAPPAECFLEKNIYDKFEKNLGENHSAHHENELFPMLASSWLADAASGRLAKPKAKTTAGNKIEAETKIEAKFKTRLGLSLMLGLRLSLMLVSNWKTHV